MELRVRPGVGAGVERFGELLRDRAAAGIAAASDRAEHGSSEALDVDARVAVEAGVFDGDDRLSDTDGNRQVSVGAVVFAGLSYLASRLILREKSGVASAK